MRRINEHTLVSGSWRKTCSRSKWKTAAAYGPTFAAPTARSSRSSGEDEARAKLAELFPVLVQMEKYAGGKRTRVIRILEDDDDWPQRPPKGLNWRCLEGDLASDA